MHFNCLPGKRHFEGNLNAKTEQNVETPVKAANVQYEKNIALNVTEKFVELSLNMTLVQFLSYTMPLFGPMFPEIFYIIHLSKNS